MPTFHTPLFAISRTMCASIGGLLLLTAMIAPAAHADFDDIVLLTRTETLDRVQLISINETEIEVREPNDTVRVVPLADCIGFVVLEVEIRTPRDGVLVLVDGQRFRGHIDTQSETRDQIQWNHQYLDALSVDFELIDWIALEPDAARPRTTDADVVVLANGDRVDGFVEELGHTLTIEPEEGGPVKIALDLVQALRLINPPAEPATDVARLWTRNGSVFDVASVQFDLDAMLRMEPPAVRLNRSEFLMHLSRVAGVLFDPAAVVSLASLEPHDLEGPIIRYVVPAPTVEDAVRALDLRDVLLSGPMTVRYTQPEGATRFVARVRLADAASEWADCELIVLDDDREVFRAPLNRDTPSAEISAGLSGAELTIQVTEGTYGPVHDRIVLERAMILK